MPRQGEAKEVRVDSLDFDGVAVDAVLGSLVNCAETPGSYYVMVCHSVVPWVWCTQSQFLPFFASVVRPVTNKFF